MMPDLSGSVALVTGAGRGIGAAVAEGLSREETQKRVNFQDRFPVDIGQEYMMDYINEYNAGSLYDKLTA